MKRLALGVGILFVSLPLAACGATPAPTPVSPTLAPLPTDTAVPTATAQPTPDPMQGWEKFEGNGVELWLPEGCEGGDPAVDAERILAGLRRLGPQYDQIAEYIEQNPSAFGIYALDPGVGTYGIPSTAIVAKQQSVTTLDAYLKPGRHALRFPVLRRVFSAHGVSGEPCCLCRVLSWYLNQ